MIALTNNSRIEVGLPELLISDKLSVAAEKKAQDMFANQYFDHDSPQGLTPWDFIKSAGYKYRHAGENLAIDFISANSAHKALMESSSHRANILNVNYSEIGIAVVEDIFEGSKSIIIVEEFGAPFVNEEIVQIKSLQITKEIIETKVNEINKEMAEKDSENLQINNKEVVENNFSKETIKGETLDSINNNENFQIDKTEKEEQIVFQSGEDEISIQADLFQESNFFMLGQENSQFDKINFLTGINENIFQEMIFETNVNESLTCNMFSDEDFENQIALNIENDIKVESLKENNSQAFVSFQDLINKSIVILLALFYTIVNVLVIYKLFFIIIV